MLSITTRTETKERYEYIHSQLGIDAISMASLQMPFWVINLYKGTWIFSEKWYEISAAILFTCGLASILTMGLLFNILTLSGCINPFHL